MEDIMKIVKSLEDSGVLIKGVTQTIEGETKEQIGGFLGMLLGTLGTSLLRNMVAGKGLRRAEKGVNRADKGVRITGEETNRTGQYF